MTGREWQRPVAIQIPLYCKKCGILLPYPPQEFCLNGHDLLKEGCEDSEQRKGREQATTKGE